MEQVEKRIFTFYSKYRTDANAKGVKENVLKSGKLILHWNRSRY